jgi:hypothetical protein
VINAIRPKRFLPARLLPARIAIIMIDETQVGLFPRGQWRRIERLGRNRVDEHGIEGLA